MEKLIRNVCSECRVKRGFFLTHTFDVKASNIILEKKRDKNCLLSSFLFFHSLMVVKLLLRASHKKANVQAKEKNNNSGLPVSFFNSFIHTNNREDSAVPFETFFYAAFHFSGNNTKIKFLYTRLDSFKKKTKRM